MVDCPVLFVHFGGDQIRGSERVLLDLVAGLRPPLSPILWCNSEVLASRVRDLGAPVYVSPMPVLLHYREPRLDLRGYWKLVKTSIRLIDDHSPRLIHASSGAPTQWLVPAARSRRIPLVTHLPAAYRKRDRCLLLLHQASAIAGPSQSAIAGLEEDGVPAERLRVIPNGVDPQRLNKGTATDLRGRLGIPGDSPVAAAIGALVNVKGFDILLHAVGHLRNEGTTRPPHVIVVGEGPERRQLESLAHALGIHDIVHFLGQQSNVGAILRDAVDFVVVPSRYESFGLVIVEAALTGKPAVATSVGGIPDVVLDGQTGLLTPPDNPRAFAEAIGRMASAPELRLDLGEAARRRASECFTVDRYRSEFRALYETLLTQPKEGYGWRKNPPMLRPWFEYGMGYVKRRIVKYVPIRE